MTLFIFNVLVMDWCGLFQTEMEERERVHQQMYLETYKKGQECAKIERYEQVVNTYQ